MKDIISSRLNISRIGVAHSIRLRRMDAKSRRPRLSDLVRPGKETSIHPHIRQSARTREVDEPELSPSTQSFRSSVRRDKLPILPEHLWLSGMTR
jgi:hypothetical protein